MSGEYEYEPIGDLMASLALQAKVLAHMCPPDSQAYGDAFAGSRFLAAAADHLKQDE